jgi:enoyl-[acyl-carrier protein] reductase II
LRHRRRQEKRRMKTKITKMLGIKYPIFQGAMAHVSSTYHLPAAVSNAGGLGILATGSHLEPRELRRQMRLLKEHTNKPYGVNVLANHPRIQEILDIIVEEGAAMASYGIGNPEKIIKTLKPIGIKCIPVIPSVKWAIRAEQDGADALIIEGMESGGHVGYISTFPLVPQVVDAVKIPVVAAGGIADARGLVAAIALGADGVQMGSRFIVVMESLVPQSTKSAIIDSHIEDTVITGNITGLRCRVLKNKLAEEMLILEEKGASEEMAQFGSGKMHLAFAEGDPVNGSVMVGQICGMMREEPSVQELFQRMVSEAAHILHSVEKKLNLPG